MANSGQGRPSLLVTYLQRAGSYKDDIVLGLFVNPCIRNMFDWYCFFLFISGDGVITTFTVQFCSDKAEKLYQHPIFSHWFVDCTAKVCMRCDAHDELVLNESCQTCMRAGDGKDYSREWGDRVASNRPTPRI